MKKILFGIFIIFLYSSAAYCGGTKADEHTRITSSFDKCIFYYITHRDGYQTLNVWAYLKNDSDKCYFIPVPSAGLKVTLNNKLSIPAIDGIESSLKKSILSETMIVRNIFSATFIILPCLEAVHWQIKRYLLNENMLHSGKAVDYEYPNIIESLNDNASGSVNRYVIYSTAEFAAKLKFMNIETGKIELINKYGNDFKFVVFDARDCIGDEKSNNNFSIINAAITFRSNKIDVPLRYLEFFGNETIWCNVFVDKFIDHYNVDKIEGGRFLYAETDTKYRMEGFFRGQLSHMTFCAKARDIKHDISMEPKLSNKLDSLRYIELKLCFVFIGVYLLSSFLSFLIVFKRIHFQILLYTLFAPVLIFVWIIDLSYSKSDSSGYVFAPSKLIKIFISSLLILNSTIIAIASRAFYNVIVFDIPIVLILSVPLLYLNLSALYSLLKRKEHHLNISREKVYYICTYFILFHSISLAFDYYICLF